MQAYAGGIATRLCALAAAGVEKRRLRKNCCANDAIPAGGIANYRHGDSHWPGDIDTVIRLTKEFDQGAVTPREMSWTHRHEVKRTGIIDKRFGRTPHLQGSEIRHAYIVSNYALSNLAVGILVPNKRFYLFGTQAKHTSRALFLANRSRNVDISQQWDLKSQEAGSS
jgi:hypothetical protein